MINLKNKSWQKIMPNDVFIGRPSPLGNPYSHLAKSFGTKLVGSREIAVENYEKWINEKIRVKDPDVCNALNDLYKRSLKGDFSLVCFCTPRLCHGSIIIKLIQQKRNEKDHAIADASMLDNEPEIGLQAPSVQTEYQV